MARSSRHRLVGRPMRGMAWLTEHDGEAPRGRHRYVRPSSGLLAVSAALLAASAAASTVPADPAPPPAPPTPPSPSVAASVGAGGSTPPTASFPATGLTSDQIVHAALTGYGTAGIPATVLEAYRRAVERTNMVQPNCHIPLALVAAIGKVETGHARGGRVSADGTTLAPILGPVLSGGPFAAIPDTDGGAYDGDAVWDRAVGPMQFIPSTWARWQADGNVDGRTDPHNIYDASLATARYLCAANRDLGTPAGLDAAVLSYNHSTSYLSLVRSWMSVYRDGTVPVAGLLDAGADPATVQAAATPPGATAPPAHPSSPPSSPTSPPPPSTPPSQPPSSGPPPVPPVTSPPTQPPAGPPPPAEPPVAEPPVPAPAPGLVCGVGNLVGGLVGGLLGAPTPPGSC